MLSNWCWRILLRVAWTARRSNQSILKEISPEYSLEGLMLKLKLQYFGHLMRGADSFEKSLMLGKIEGRRRRGQEKMRWLDGITSSMDLNLTKLWEIDGEGQEGLACCSPWVCKELDITERLNNKKLFFFNRHIVDLQCCANLYCTWKLLLYIQACTSPCSFVHGIDQVPLSMGFSRQEYWSGCHALPQGLFLTQRSNSCLLCLLHWQAGSLPLEPPWNHSYIYIHTFFSIIFYLRRLNIVPCSIHWDLIVYSF